MKAGAREDRQLLAHIPVYDSPLGRLLMPQLVSVRTSSGTVPHPEASHPPHHGKYAVDGASRLSQCEWILHSSESEDRVICKGDNKICGLRQHPYFD